MIETPPIDNLIGSTQMNAWQQGNANFAAKKHP